MFPGLITERLLLRRIESADAPVVLQGYSNPAVNQYMSVSYHSIEEVAAQLSWYEQIFASGEGIWWGICLHNGTMIGNGGFHNYKKEHGCIELGYWILPAWHHEGYATEAAEAMCRYAFEQLDVHRIEAIVEDGNKASLHMLDKMGFINEGCRRECERKNGQYINLWTLARFNPTHDTAVKDGQRISHIHVI